LADLNGTTADQGIFVFEAGRLSTVVSRRVAAGERLSGPDLNVKGDLTFAADEGVFRRLRATGQTTLVVPTGAEGVPRRPRIDEDGAVIWLTDGGLFHWSDATGTRVVARTGAPGSPGSGTITDLLRAAVRTGGVAFVAETSSADSVFLWDAALEETRLLARVGDSTDGGDIVRIRPRVDFRPDGTVVFRAKIRQGGRNRLRWVVATGSSLTVSTGSGLSGSGGAASESHESWYRRAGGRVTSVARIGDVVPRVGPIEEL